jgi:hypothetical protein
LLSPANLTGKRASLLLREDTGVELARALRAGSATLADVFAFTSSLYFRGKRAYARAFANPPAAVHGAWVITTDRGLIPMETLVHIAMLRQMAAGTIDPAQPAYREPLVKSASQLRQAVGQGCRAVLLGSLATDKYLAPLLEVWGDALQVPEAFIGRGDMSRGGLMLRAVDELAELDYVAAARAARSGPRPPRLPPRRRPGSGGESGGESSGNADG